MRTHPCVHLGNHHNRLAIASCAIHGAASGASRATRSISPTKHSSPAAPPKSRRSSRSIAGAARAAVPDHSPNACTSVSLPACTAKTRGMPSGSRRSCENALKRKARGAAALEAQAHRLRATCFSRPRLPARSRSPGAACRVAPAPRCCCHARCWKNRTAATVPVDPAARTWRPRRCAA